jgi:hypothetical protein
MEDFVWITPVLGVPKDGDRVAVKTLRGDCTEAVFKSAPYAHWEENAAVPLETYAFWRPLTVPTPEKH